MSSYTAENISILQGLNAVREVPGMYIGDPSTAVSQMLFEVIDNAVDEFLAKHCTEIYVSVDIGNETCTFLVEDNGRGIPVDIHPKAGVPALEVVLGTLHAGSKFQKTEEGSYTYSGGLHGVGVSVTNALSRSLEARVFKEGKIYFINFMAGQKQCDVHVIGETTKVGTQIKFEPDFSIVDRDSVPTHEQLVNRLREISILHQGLKIVLNFNGAVENFVSNGLVDLISNEQNMITSPIIFQNEDMEVILCWTSGHDEKYWTFTNGIRQRDGGTHLTGLKSGISRAICNYFENINKKTSNIISEDAREGLVAVLSLRLMKMQFSSQTKEKLVSTEARSLVEKFVISSLEKWLDKNPNEATKIVNRVLLAAKTRANLSKTREETSKSFKLNVSTKLSNCQSEDPLITELFLLEGESAGGSAKQSRDRYFQAILSLRGKLLNVERATMQDILKCKEIISLILTIGTDIGDKFDINKLRYGKIIIMTDADVDGAHIFTLILIFFVKFMPEIISRGHLYVARPPLFKVTTKNNKVYYMQDSEELNDFMLDFIFRNEAPQENGYPLTFDEFKQRFIQYKDFVNNVQRENKNIDLNLASCILSGVHDKFQDQEILISEGERKYEVQLKSPYGSIYYTINKISKMISYIPMEIGGKLFKSPKELLDAIEQKFHQKVYIQRYKGLGEMNPSELAETSLKPEKRRIQQLFLPTDKDLCQKVIDECQKIMGQEEDRKEFILSRLGMFGVKASA